MNNVEENEWLTKIASAGQLKTPFILTDLDIIRFKAGQFAELLPRVGIYYAVKSNNDPRVLQALNGIVDGFDIASLGEYEILQKLGVHADRILYSNPVKVPSHITQTYREGVQYFALDSLSEIEKLREHAPGSTVHIRVKVSDYGSKFPLSGKFGLDPEHVLTYASAAQDAGLQVKGLTFHVGSQAENIHVWEAAIDLMGKLIRKLEKRGISIEYLDIGGGFPARYEDLAPSMEEVAEVVNASLEAHIPSTIRIVAEPGRFISANASIVGASVIGREHRSGTDWLYVDIGVFQGLIEPLEMPNWRYPVITKKHPSGYKKSFVLTGPTCDAYDTLGLDYQLPSDLNVGDNIYLSAAGAYSTVYGSQFNGFDMPAAYYVGDGKA